MNLVIDAVRFKGAGPVARRNGLIGWVTCRLNGTMLIDGISIRRTIGGRTTISFPARHDDAGRKHFILRPLDEQTRQTIERQILEALGIDSDGGTE